MFNLRISLPDIAKAGAVQSDLRIAILKALREANIEIPFNQIDVNLRDLDGVGASSPSTSRTRRQGCARRPRPASGGEQRQARGNGKRH